MSTFGTFSRRKINPDFLKNRLDSEKISKKILKNIFSDCADFEFRDLALKGKNSPCAAAFWIDGLVNSIAVSEDIIFPFSYSGQLAACEDSAQQIRCIMNGGIFSCSARLRDNLWDTVSDILMGHCVIIFDGSAQALSFDIKSLATRAIGEPSVEKTLKGAKDAFVEAVRLNTALVRRKLRHPDLKMEQIKVGRKSSTTVAIMYVKELADEKTLAKLRQRLQNIRIDGLLSAGNIEQYITDCPLSPFPQLLHTERPDKFAIELLEGRIGLFADGLPLGFLLHAPLAYFMKVGDDRAGHFMIASFLTLLRWASLLLAIVLPGLLVALSMYHQEMIPTRLLLSMIESAQRVPFSSALEVLGMLLAFELLQEAGLRLPNPVGDTVSIIGALIVGQAAVEARVVSPIAVIIVAAAGLCGFALPSQDMGGAVRLLRLAVTLLAIALGLYGIMLGLMLLVWHLCSIDSFGIAYTAPLSEGGLGRALSVLIRPPLWTTRRRDPELGSKDGRNQK